MNHIEPKLLAYGAFFILIISILWKNKKKGNKLIEEITGSLQVTIDSFRQLTFSEYFGLPEGCALKTDEWHVGYTLYFACSTQLELDSIVAILLVDLKDLKYEIIHIQDIVAHHERQIIIIKKGKRTFKMYVTHGANSDANMNLYSVHIELNR